MTPLLVRAGRIVTCDTQAPQNGVTFDDLGTISDGGIACEDEQVAWCGPMTDLPKRFNSFEVVEFGDCIVVPGLVDAHAHPLFAGSREADFAARIRAEPLPLGMLYTVERTREALEHQESFWKFIRKRLEAMLRHGTTTLETKTGYALHAPGEMELLSLIAHHKDDPEIPSLVATFLGAHAVPPEFRNEVDYVDYLIDQCLPVAKAHGAIYADAFCEPGYFSPQQAARYLEAARAHGLRLRCHCDEMAYAGAAAMATALKADSVDHCNWIADADVGAIAGSGAVMVACPATIDYLGLGRHAPVRALLQAGGTVALGSDFNPGTSPCFNLQTIVYFGRKIFGLSAAETLYGVTLAAAKSLRVAAGRIAAGARADFVALRLEHPDEFGWQFGGNLAAAVIHRGTIVA